MARSNVIAITAAALAFFTLPTSAQVQQVWERHYPSPGGLQAYGMDVAVDAADNVGNTSTPNPVVFTIIVTPESIIDAVGQLEEAGMLDERLVRSLKAKLENGQKKWGGGQCGPAKNVYRAFIQEIRAQTGKKITPEAASILSTDAEYLIGICDG